MWAFMGIPGSDQAVADWPKPIIQDIKKLESVLYMNDSIIMNVLFYRVCHS